MNFPLKSHRNYMKPQFCWRSNLEKTKSLPCNHFGCSASQIRTSADAMNSSSAFLTGEENRRTPIWHSRCKLFSESLSTKQPHANWFSCGSIVNIRKKRGGLVNTAVALSGAVRKLVYEFEKRFSAFVCEREILCFRRLNCVITASSSFDWRAKKKQQ